MIPFGSCGMAQDLLRSCYRGVMRPFSDDDAEVRVYWYFTDKKAPFLPVPSAFVSANWDAERDYVASIGEGDRDKRRWANGRTPAWVHPGYFGPAAAWLDGVKKAESVVTVLNIDGSDPRCVPAQLCREIGVPDTLWANIRVRYAFYDEGGTDTTLAFALAKDSPTTWRGASAPDRYGTVWRCQFT